MHYASIKKIKSCQELLEKYNQKGEEKPISELLVFDIHNQETIKRVTAPFKKQSGEEQEAIATDITFYNPTKVIEKQGKKRLAVRVEPKDDEFGSHTMFFEEQEKVWKLASDTPFIAIQDPFHIDNIHGYQVLGGVRVYRDPNGQVGYETVFYKYKEGLVEIKEPFAIGPKKMKDIRLIELASNRIGVFTRPQGGIAGRGKIGYTEIETLNDLTPEIINQAPIIPDQFVDGEWGGVNDLVLLENKKIGVIGHIAHYESNQKDGDAKTVKNYYAMAFVFDPETREATEIEIIATADDLPVKIEPKTPTLGKVIFSGGIKRNGNGTAHLYAGIGDIKAVNFIIQDPFIKYEKLS